MKQNALFIVLEGIDGSGTSTHSRILKSSLEDRGYNVHITQEPSGSDVGKVLRKYLKDPNVPPSTDALLFAADRTIHYYLEIKKYLDQGYIVISDRYLESSIVYQSVQSEELSIEWIENINKFAPHPDLTILLDIDPKIALQRKTDEELEKFENLDFLNSVRTLYKERAEKLGYYIVSSDNIIELTQQEIQEIVFPLLEQN